MLEATTTGSGRFRAGRGGRTGLLRGAWAGAVALSVLALSPLELVPGSPEVRAQAHAVAAEETNPEEAEEAVMIAAGQWALERLPSGAAGLDPHRSGAGKDASRVRRVAAALGMELTTLDQTKQCRDALDAATCTLSLVRLLVIGFPTVDGDRADLKVFAWYRSDSARSPVGEQRWELSLRRTGEAWRVVSGG